MIILRSGITALSFLFVCSCGTMPMREITARNNGTRFWMHSAAWLTGKWDYEGGTNKAGQAHGFGSYTMTYGDVHAGNGNFINGQPDGVHAFSNDLVDGTQIFSNGKRVSLNTTRNEVPQVLIDSLSAVATLGTDLAAKSQRRPPAILSSQPSARDTSGPWYPITYIHRPGMAGMYINGKKYDNIILKPGAGTHWGKPG